MKTQAISAVIPVHDAGEALHKCLEAILIATDPPTEIVVVDDGGTDDLTEVASWPPVTLLTLATQGGPGKARNAGADASEGEILFFVDADVVVPPDTFVRARNAFAADPDLAAVFGSYDDTPHELNFVSQYRNLLHHYVHQRSREEASTFWAGCGAVRRSVFEAAGGFDENRYSKPSIEDIELGRRLHRKGLKIRLDKSMQVKHLKRWTPSSVLRTDFFQRALPWTELILSEREAENDLNTTIADRLSVFFSVLMAGSLLVVPFEPRLAAVILLAAAGLLALNWRLYEFFRSERGLLFALKTIPWHWLHFLSSGIAFAYGVLRHVRQRLSPEGAP